MSYSRRAVGAVAIVLVLAIAGAGVYLRITNEAAAAGTADGGSAAGAGRLAGSAAGAGAVPGGAVAVEGVEVVRDTLVLSVAASGQAEAWRRVEVPAEVSGRVDRLPVREADRVSGGELLVALDPVDRQLALDDAESALREAQARYREQLLFDGDLPEEVRRERESAARLRNGLDRAEIQVRKARLALERTRVRAPFGGRVASVAVVPGQVVTEGTTLLTVVDVDPIRLEVQVLEGELAHLAPGGGAEVRFSAFPDELFRGAIETINPLVQERTRTARVTVRIPNPRGRILPGMYARVRLDARRVPDRILVPRSAILERDRRTMLFVLEEGRAKWRYVTTGLENDEQVEIVENPETSMVEPGEVVLTDGHFTLTHDAPVRRVDELGAADEGGRP